MVFGGKESVLVQFLPAENSFKVLSLKSFVQVLLCFNILIVISALLS